ncbi:Acyl carrier protein phosphodiesterase [Neolewinella maritima]|uniref:Acyl carrier protein phosphodiesterase n=1 Tax=Neolewinella maritima TaxID=1383882 RepID=A0ABN8F1A7_9BACT|nr:ACP phosphodiesterase [Neolewinella maritima]CAH1000486.1 Acyl carrier protein phosphodiesterase [Neolewinella maritima]
MNYLAHLALSHFSPDLQVGNFLGDILRGSEVDLLPAGIRRGVTMHRAIDRLTDADPDVRRLNRLLTVRHSRYAPVLSDVAFDYFLCLNWSQLMDVDIVAFRTRTYGNLQAAREHMPERAARHVDGMTKSDWLRLYTSAAGMQQVFLRMRPRMSQPHYLNDIDESLRELAPQFNRTLLLLFPRLQTLADTFRDPTQLPDPH